MTYRVLLRPAAMGFDVWVPELPGLASSGATEEEAVRNIQKAIRGRLDLDHESAPESQAFEMTVDVVDPAILATKAKRVKPEELPAPVPINGDLQLYVGAGILACAIIGIMFFFMIERQSSPLFLFLPFVVLAFGFLGIFFGFISKDSRKPTL